MLVPDRLFLDPALDQRNLLARQAMTGAGGRHAFVGRSRCNAADQVARGRIAVDNHRGPVAAGENALPPIEPQVGFAFRVIRTVTGKTGLGKDRPDLAIEIDLGGRLGREDGRRGQRETQNPHRPFEEQASIRPMVPSRQGSRRALVNEA